MPQTDHVFKIWSWNNRMPPMITAATDTLYILAHFILAAVCFRTNCGKEYLMEKEIKGLRSNYLPEVTMAPHG